MRPEASGATSQVNYPEHDGAHSPDKQPAVYVLGGWLPNGGALMAYEVGQIVANLMQAQLIVLPARDESHPSDFFDYSGTASLGSMAEFHQRHTPDDILILNPLFHRDLYSLVTRCRIISYVQHYTTFDHLDPGCDLYVAGSQFIAQHIAGNDGIDAPVINPFLPHADHIEERVPEKSRMGLISYKGNPQSRHAIIEMMRRDSRHFAGFEDIRRGRRRDLLQQLSNSRLFFTPVVAEGFGLLPLEAMLQGCIVFGLDGHGGQDYLRYGENSFCLEMRNVHELPGVLDDIVTNLENLDSVIDNARATARSFSYDIFEAEWQRVLREFL